MAAGAKSSSHQADVAAKRRCTSPPARRPCKATAKDVDWADVSDPEERRRIQNRIAQRKFREKARENRERAERESRNQELAGNSYRIPRSAPDLSASRYGADSGPEEELSGLPWGGVSLSLVVSRGHEAESRRSSGRGTYIGDEPVTAAPSPPYTLLLVMGAGGDAMYNSYSLHQSRAHDHLAAMSYCSTGVGDSGFFDDASYAYDAMTAYPPLL